MMKRIGMITMLVLFVTGAQAHQDEESQGWISWSVETAVKAAVTVGIYEGALANSDKFSTFRLNVLEKVTPVASLALKIVMTKLAQLRQPASVDTSTAVK